MFRVAFRVARPAQVIPRATLTRLPTITPCRTFFGGSNNDAANSDTVEKFAKALQDNPNLLELLTGFSKILADKGIASGQPPTMMQMMSILRDKEIRDHLTLLQEELTRSNIKITQGDLSALTDLYTKQIKKE